MTINPDQAWAPDPRPIEPELADTFEADPYVDPWNSIMERIEGASKDKLLAIYGGHPMSWRNTEIGGE